jgi:hypothetical protein
MATSKTAGCDYNIGITIVVQAYSSECTWSADELKQNLESLYKDDFESPIWLGDFLHVQVMEPSGSDYRMLVAHISSAEHATLEKLPDFERYADVLAEKLHNLCEDSAVIVTAGVDIKRTLSTFFDLDKARTNAVAKGLTPRY